jgi:hypothetical protein
MICRRLLRKPKFAGTGNPDLFLIISILSLHSSGNPQKVDFGFRGIKIQ